MLPGRYREPTELDVEMFRQVAFRVLPGRRGSGPFQCPCDRIILYRFSYPAPPTPPAFTRNPHTPETTAARARLAVHDAAGQRAGTIAHRWPMSIERARMKAVSPLVSGFSFDFQDLVLKPVAKSAAP